jgi:arylsulfatase A-like enzyme
MRGSSRLLASLLAAHAAILSACGPAADPATFHVVVVTLDTTRADRIGAFGGEAVPTPNLDRASLEGVRFTQAISTNPLTLPAHTSMFTGRYPFRHGVRHNGAYRVPADEVTLAEWLGDHGFRTAAFVGAFVLDASFGLDQGFQTYSGVDTDGASADFLRPASMQRTADAVNQSFFEWLDSFTEGRFFAWVHYYDPHHPYSPPELAGVDLQGTGYDREISFVDHQFGQLIAGLEQRRILDRTLLVVIGDHGESLGDHGENTHGIFLYEPAVHVPFAVRAPGLVAGGATFASPVSVADVAPTVLGLLRLPPLAAADGRSLFETNGKLVDEDFGRRVYAETWMPRIELGWSELAMLRGDRHKFVRAPRRELYDLVDDPGERSNLADVDREIADDFERDLAEMGGRDERES